MSSTRVLVATYKIPDSLADRFFRDVRTLVCKQDINIEMISVSGGEFIFKLSISRGEEHLLVNSVRKGLLFMHWLPYQIELFKQRHNPTQDLVLAA